MPVLTTLTATFAGKAVAALTGLTLAGGGAALVMEATETAQEKAPAIDEFPSQETVESADVDLLNEEGDTPQTGTEDEEGRSGDVHDALTGGEAEPGDEDFGQTVSENAREGGRDFGQNVAEAARDGAGENASAEGRERADEASAEGRARADEARDNDNRNDEGGEPDEQAEANQQSSEKREQTPASDAPASPDTGDAARDAGPANADRAQGGR